MRSPVFLLLVSLVVSAGLSILDHYLANLDEVPATDPDAGPVQRVTDYIAGMTDRFCLSTYEQLVARQ